VPALRVDPDRWDDRYRRNFLLATHLYEGRLSRPIAAVPAWRPERVFMPPEQSFYPTDVGPAWQSGLRCGCEYVSKRCRVSVLGDKSRRKTLEAESGRVVDVRICGMRTGFSVGVACRPSCSIGDLTLLDPIIALAVSAQFSRDRIRAERRSAASTMMKVTMRSSETSRY
jgi:hypothetical protein